MSLVTCGLLHSILACGSEDYLEVDLTDGQAVTLTFRSDEVSLTEETSADILVTQQ